MITIYVNLLPNIDVYLLKFLIKAKKPFIGHFVFVDEFLIVRDAFIVTSKIQQTSAENGNEIL